MPNIQVGNLVPNGRKVVMVQGELSSIGVPELFRAVAHEGKTGCLSISRLDAEARIFFRSGEAYHARLLGSGVQLGARLISAGYITHEDLERSLEIQRSNGRNRRLGEVLIGEDLVTREQMSTIVQQQIEDTIFEILRWDGGTFTLEEGVESDEDIGIQISVENLVMEGARRFREWHQISRRIPTLDAIPDLREDDTEIEVALTPEEWALVSRLDGKATIADLARSCGFTDLEAARTVFGLLTAGLIKVVLPEGVELPFDDPDLDAVFDELEQALKDAAKDGSDDGQTPPTLDEITKSNMPTLEVTERSMDLPGLDELPVIDEADRMRPEAEISESTMAMLPSEIGETEATIDAALAEPEMDVVEEIVEAEMIEPEMIEPEMIVDEIAVEPEVDEPEMIEAELIDNEMLIESVKIEEEPAFEEVTLDERSIGELAEDASQSWGDLKVASETESEEVVLQETLDMAPTAFLAEEVVEESVAEEVITEEVATEEVAAPVDDFDQGALARMFAELSSPAQEPDVHSAPQREEEPAEEKPTVKEAKPHERSVDPSVDTSALLRELSGLGLGDLQGSNPSFPENNEARPVQQSPTSAAKVEEDKGRGLFGKKRR